MYKNETRAMDRRREESLKQRGGRVSEKTNDRAGMVRQPRKRNREKKIKQESKMRNRTEEGVEIKVNALDEKQSRLTAKEKDIEKDSHLDIDTIRY